MDEQQRASVLGNLATDAGRKRDEFLDDAGRQFARFIDGNKRQFRDLGGLVLIDDGPEYLFVTEEGTFRSRTRYRDDDGNWVAETEDIEDAADLVEIYNPADLYAAFADAARDEAELGIRQEPQAEEEGLAPEDEDVAEGVDAAEGDEDEAIGEREFDQDWLTPLPAPRDRDEAARTLYDLALTFQERSQFREAQLLDDFQVASGNVAGVLGDSKIADDEDERLWFRASGAFEGEVVPEMDEQGEPVWQALTLADEMVQFYDPTDLFGDLAEAIAEQHPHVAPELEDEAADRDGGDATDE